MTPRPGAPAGASTRAARCADQAAAAGLHQVEAAFEPVVVPVVRVGHVGVAAGTGVRRSAAAPADRRSGSRRPRPGPGWPASGGGPGPCTPPGRRGRATPCRTPGPGARGRRSPGAPVHARARGSIGSPSCHPPVPALDTARRSARTVPSASVCPAARWRSTTSPIGERQMLPVHTKITCSGPGDGVVIGWGGRHPSSLARRRARVPRPVGGRAREGPPDGGVPVRCRHGGRAGRCASIPGRDR